MRQLALRLRFYENCNEIKASKCAGTIVNTVDIVKKDVDDDDIDCIGAFYEDSKLIFYDIIDSGHGISYKNRMEAIGC